MLSITVQFSKSTLKPSVYTLSQCRMALEEPEQFLFRETGNQIYEEPEQFLFQEVGNQIYQARMEPFQYPSVR